MELVFIPANLKLAELTDKKFIKKVITKIIISLLSLNKIKKLSTTLYYIIHLFLFSNKLELYMFINRVFYSYSK